MVLECLVDIFIDAMNGIFLAVCWNSSGLGANKYSDHTMSQKWYSFVEFCKIFFLMTLDLLMLQGRITHNYEGRLVFYEKFCTANR